MLSVWKTSSHSAGRSTVSYSHRVVRKREIISCPSVLMFVGMRVRSSFPASTCDRTARERFSHATDSGDPMNRKRQSGGTTAMKCRSSGARAGSARLSIRSATLETLKGAFRGLKEDGGIVEDRVEDDGSSPYSSRRRGTGTRWRAKYVVITAAMPRRRNVARRRRPVCAHIVAAANLPLSQTRSTLLVRILAMNGLYLTRLDFCSSAV